TGLIKCIEPIFENVFGDNAPGNPQKLFQYRRLAPGEIKTSRAHRGVARDRVEAELAEAVNPVLPRPGSPQDCAQPRLEFGEVDRLDEIIVGARVQATNPAFDAV